MVCRRFKTVEKIKKSGHLGADQERKKACKYVPGSDQPVIRSACHRRRMADHFENGRYGIIRMINKNFLRVFLFVASLIRLSVAQITPPNPSLITLQHFV